MESIIEQIREYIETLDTMLKSDLKKFSGFKFSSELEGESLVVRFEIDKIKATATIVIRKEVHFIDSVVFLITEDNIVTELTIKELLRANEIYI